MIRLATDEDLASIASTINDAAQAYRGVIPADCWHEPYMSQSELREEVDAEVVFCVFECEAELIGVMGLQQVEDVALIRHAYVKTKAQRAGIGAKLLRYWTERTARPMLIGTWAAADWAVRFYERHGFEVTSPEQKKRLLRRYWTVPDRQIETSVVLADTRWRDTAIARDIR